MEKLSRKEKERLQRHNLILDAAEEVINEYGFENAKMDQIAEKAEVGKGTLYLYFKSKTAIYIAICERGSRILNEQMAQVLTQDIPGLAMLEKLGKTYLNFIQNNPQYFHAFSYYESVITDEEIQSLELAQQCEQNARDAMTYIVRSLQIGMQDGSVDDSYDPKQLGVMIWGASKGIVNMAFLKQKKSRHKILEDVDVSLDSLIKQFIQLIGRGISKKND